MASSSPIDLLTIEFVDKCCAGVEYILTDDDGGHDVCEVPQSIVDNQMSDEELAVRAHVIVGTECVMLDGEVHFEVERIIEHRLAYYGNAARIEYLVRWLGYSSLFDTWEPIINLTGCDELLNDYLYSPLCAFIVGRQGAL